MSGYRGVMAWSGVVFLTMNRWIQVYRTVDRSSLMDGNITDRGVGTDRANLADLLTLSRLLVTPLIAWLVAARSLDTAVVLLGFAWCTDILDGRLARAALRVTRLNGWDLRADAWLSAGLGVGLGLGGYFSWWIVAPVAGVAFVGSLLFTNPSPVMVGIGALSGMFLWTVLRQASLWWLPGVYLAALLLADWRRFWGVILPALWYSLMALAPGDRRRETSLVLDDWVD